jgi:putative transposase
VGSEFEARSRRDLRGIEPVYLWADGLYVKAGVEKDKAAQPVVVAGLRDGRKVVVAVESGNVSRPKPGAGCYATCAPAG